MPLTPVDPSPESEQRLEQDAVLAFLSAIKAAKLYQPDNPVASQLAAKALALLTRYFQTHPALRIAVKESGLLCGETEISGDAFLCKTIPRDLFTAGIRGMSVLPGIDEGQLRAFFRLLMLLREDVVAQGGWPSLLRDEGISHIEVTDDRPSAVAAEGPRTSGPGGMETAESGPPADPEELARLLREQDRRMLHTQGTLPPPELLEALSGRSADALTGDRVASLLQHAPDIEKEPHAAAAEHPFSSDHLRTMARALSEYTPAELSSLKRLAEPDPGDALRTAAATLARLLPAALRQAQGPSQEQGHNAVAAVLHRVDSLLPELLSNGAGPLAVGLLRALHLPADPVHKTLLQRSLKRAGGKGMMIRLVQRMQTLNRDSEEYRTLRAYLDLVQHEAAPALLEMLAEEDDYAARKVLIRILKDLGKNQIALLGERLSDERWYFVRNIVGILGESRREEVIDYLEQVAGHANFQIRQEVVRALMTIGGGKATGLLTRFLKDSDVDIRFMAVRGLGSLGISGGGEEEALMRFIRRGWFRNSDHDLRLEAIASLGRIGGARASAFLRDRVRPRWWMSARQRHEIRAAAIQAAEEIERRTAHA